MLQQVVANAQVAPFDTASEFVDWADEAVGEGSCRRLLDFARRSDFLDFPFVHLHNRVGDFKRFFLVVGHEQ